MKRKICRSAKIFIKAVVTTFNILMFVVFLLILREEWQALRDKCEPELKYYIESLEKKEAPYWDMATDILTPYLLPEWHIERESYSYDPNKIAITYECWLMEGERDIYGFYVTVGERTKEAKQNCYPVGDGRYVMRTDFVQQAFCNMMIDCNEEYYQEHGYYVLMPISSMRRNDRVTGFGNYYGGVKLQVLSSRDKDALNWLFEETYRRMHTWQQKAAASMETDIWLAESGAEEEGETYHLSFEEKYGGEPKRQLACLGADILAYADSEAAKKQMTYYANWMIPEPEGQDGTKEQGIYYTVRRGDCLWDIAAKYYGDGTWWSLLYRDNREKIGMDANLLYEGLVLYIREW